MNKKKEFDCVQFKYELQEKTLKNSGAKNLREYAAYVNKIAQESSLHKWERLQWITREKAIRGSGPAFFAAVCPAFDSVREMCKIALDKAVFLLYR